MQDARLGASVRALRHRRGWRQVDLAARARCSEATVSRLERGEVGRLQVDAVRRVAAAVEMTIDLVPRWRSGDLDRLVNARHARMSSAVAAWLLRRGWLVAPEVSFSIWGERGSVDLLAWRSDLGALGVFELKTEVADPLALLAQVERYRRLAPMIAGGRGWSARRVGVWVVIADSTTNQRRVAEAAAILRAALPGDGRRLHAWIRNPDGDAAGLAFLSEPRVETLNRQFAPRRRVRRRDMRSPRA